MDPSKPVRAAKQAADKVSASADPPPPGVPAPEPPSLEEPTQPREPLPPREDQTAPETVTATGAETGAARTARAQQGEYLTTAQGVRLYDTDHSLKAGRRGPTLLQDHHLREKITHFDHERIPERVVHARGAAAHGVFVANGAAASVTRAGFLAKGKETPVFTRFSPVAGSRGSADAVRDTRGFATKFYTDEGTFDLVGNNMPVFFIQDGIKFPDLIHSVKPRPDREIPQAQSAHDTFWDFVSLHTEATHHLMWHISDRGIPRSYRMMEGFGIHTFRLVDEAGETSLVKWHWKPRLGVHSLTWEEAQMLNGVDPDFHRRDLWDAIESGAYPEWDLGIQVFPDNPEQTFEGIDLLDPTKIVPEELSPVQVVGTMTLHANPTNFFAETEQVAFHPGHVVPGIDVTDDPLLQARLFSYLDTQITRLGGPNFAQIPINRPHAPVNDMFREGFHQHGVHTGVAPYRPNSLDGGCPFLAGEDTGALVEVPQELAASVKERGAPASFEDHFSQAQLFWDSMTPVEQDHLIQAFTFELGKCYEQTVKQRALRVLANVDPRLCASVAAGLGLPAPEAGEDVPRREPSPALSQVGDSWPVAGRMVAVVVDPDGDLDAVEQARTALLDAGVLPLLLAPHGGTLPNGRPVQRTLLTARSVEFDAVILAGAPAAAPDAVPGLDAKAGAATSDGVDPRVRLLLEETYRHAKAIGAWTGKDALDAAAVPADAAGVVVGVDPADVVAQVVQLLGGHRVWERFPAASA